MESIISDCVRSEIVKGPALLPLSNEASLLEGCMLEKQGAANG
jgi:hypothetical protein